MTISFLSFQYQKMISTVVMLPPAADEIFFNISSFSLRDDGS
jgi:hypothetical protein